LLVLKPHGLIILLFFGDIFCDIFANRDDDDCDGGECPHR
jgi:hypothetical protein